MPPPSPAVLQTPLRAHKHIKARINDSFSKVNADVQDRFEKGQLNLDDLLGGIDVDGECACMKWGLV